MPTGTVAVAGVIETRIPESRPTCPVPVFFLSASAVAIKLTMGIGFGKLLSDGAVYVKTFEPLVALVVHVDRKSTRLNSSHTVISYAVFCLKKKKKDRKF